MNLDGNNRLSIFYALKFDIYVLLNCTQSYGSFQIPFKAFFLPRNFQDSPSFSSIFQAFRESPPKFENQTMARLYVRSIMRSTMYQKAPFCLPEMAQ